MTAPLPQGRGAGRGEALGVRQGRGPRGRFRSRETRGTSSSLGANGLGQGPSCQQTGRSCGPGWGTQAPGTEGPGGEQDGRRCPSRGAPPSSPASHCKHGCEAPAHVRDRAVPGGDGPRGRADSRLLSSGSDSGSPERARRCRRPRGAAGTGRWSPSSPRCSGPHLAHTREARLSPASPPPVPAERPSSTHRDGAHAVPTARRLPLWDLRLSRGRPSCTGAPRAPHAHASRTVPAARPRGRRPSARPGGTARFVCRRGGDGLPTGLSGP